MPKIGPPVQIFNKEDFWQLFDSCFFPARLIGISPWRPLLEDAMDFANLDQILPPKENSETP